MNTEVLDKYTKTYGVRFSRKQKNKFIKTLSEDFKVLGYEPTLIRGKKLILRADNYLFGNVKQMKTVIVVPYDTPERKFWYKVPYFPMNGTRTSSKTMAATYVPILILFVLIFGGLYGIQPLIESLQIANMMSAVLLVLTMMLIYWMLHGVRNNKNYNRNSASIAQALEIAKKLNKDERKKVGFLFTDKNKIRFLGAESSANDFVKNGKNPNLIYLDCIGSGKDMMIGYVPQNRKLATEVAKYYTMKKEEVELVKLTDEMRMQSAMSFFKKAVIISSGEKDTSGNLCVMGTSTGKDTLLDEGVMDAIGDMVYRFLHSQK